MRSNNSNSINNKFRLRGFGNGDVLVTTVLFGGMFGYCLFVCLFVLKQTSFYKHTRSSTVLKRSS